ncbi:hypothetical protein AGLY_014532, partial [Aphis glycines]
MSVSNTMSTGHTTTTNSHKAPRNTHSVLRPRYYCLATVVVHDRTNNKTVRQHERFARLAKQVTRPNKTCKSTIRSDVPGRYHFRHHYRLPLTAASHHYLFRYHPRLRCHQGFQVFPVHPFPLSGINPKTICHFLRVFSALFPRWPPLINTNIVISYLFMCTSDEIFFKVLKHFCRRYKLNNLKTYSELIFNYKDLENVSAIFVFSLRPTCSNIDKTHSLKI